MPHLQAPVFRSLLPESIAMFPLTGRNLAERRQILRSYRREDCLRSLRSVLSRRAKTRIDVALITRSFLYRTTRFVERDYRSLQVIRRVLSDRSPRIN